MNENKRWLKKTMIQKQFIKQIVQMTKNLRYGRQNENKIKGFKSIEFDMQRSFYDIGSNGNDEPQFNYMRDSKVY